MWHQMPSRRIQSGAARQHVLARGNQPLWNHPVLDDLAIVIDVVDEQIQGLDALLEPALDVLPLARLDNPRHDVEGPDLFGSRLVAIDVERDAHVQQGQIGSLLAPFEFPFGKRGQPLGQHLGQRPWTTVGLEHFVITAVRLVGVEFDHRTPPFSSWAAAVPRRVQTAIGPAAAQH